MGNVLNYWILALFLALIGGEVFRFQISDVISVKVMDVVITGIILHWALFHIIQKKPFQISSFIWYGGVFIGIGFVSLLLNPLHLSPQDLITSSLYGFRFLCYVLLIPIVYESSTKTKQFILNGLLIVGGIHIILGFIQYFFYNNLRNLYYLGWDEHMYRLFSTFLDPNFAGAFLVLVFLLALNKYLGKKVLYHPLLFFLAINFLAIFLTFSRSALLMLVVSTFVLLWLHKKISYVFVIGGILLLGTLFSSRYFYVENINLFRTASSEARVTSAQEVLEIIKKNPVLGIGFNTYRYALHAYGFRSVPGEFVSHADGSTDNSFLFVLATTGIIGLAFYLLFLVVIGKNAMELYSNGNHIAPAVFASLIGLAVNSLFINSLFYPYIMVWLWILVGSMKKV